MKELHSIIGPGIGIDQPTKLKPQYLPTAHFPNANLNIKYDPGHGLFLIQIGRLLALLQVCNLAILGGQLSIHHAFCTLEKAPGEKNTGSPLQNGLLHMQDSS